MRGSLLLLGGLGCGSPPGAAPAAADAPADDGVSEALPTGEPCPFDGAAVSPEEQGVAFESPRDGAILRAPWVPLQLHAEGDRSGSAVDVCLDGALLTLPLGIFRHRNSAVGGGWDFIASLDMVALEPGEHVLSARLTEPGGEVRVAESRLIWDRPQHRVDLEVTDGAGRPVSARVVLTDGDGEPVDLGSADDATDPHDRDVGLHSVFAVAGAATVYLDAGRWRFVAVRSVLDGLGTAVIDLDSDTVVALDVPVEVSAPEYLTADLHVHSGRSGDSHIPDDARVHSLAAAGLDVVVSTDHRSVVDLQPSFDAVGGDLPALVPGIEAAVRDYSKPSAKSDRAHYNVFPLLGGSHAPIPGVQPPTVAALYDEYRARQRAAPFPGVGSDLVIELNHPRGIQFRPDESPRPGAWPLFNALGFDPTVPVGEGVNAWMTTPELETGTTALGFDAMEIINRFSLPLYLQVRDDWFALLNQGHRITGTGNSDSHALQVELAGFPVNLVRSVGEDGGLDLVGFLGAVKRGNLVVTTGPLVELEVEGSGGSVGRPGDDVAADGGKVGVLVRVRAASWIEVDEVRVVVNGVVVEKQGLIGHDGVPTDEVFAWEIPVAADSWVLAEAGWPLEPVDDQPRAGGDYGLVAPAYVPLAFTNPVFIDADGGGPWSPPGL